jgi:hypothetical protein
MKVSRLKFALKRAKPGHFDPIEADVVIPADGYEPSVRLYQHQIEAADRQQSPKDQDRERSGPSC